MSNRGNLSASDPKCHKLFLDILQPFENLPALRALLELLAHFGPIFPGRCKRGEYSL